MIDHIITLKVRRKNFLVDRFVWRMAFRDARKNATRLLLFASSLVTGIAALVAIGSLNDSVQGDIDRNALELLGADLVANANRAFEPEITAMLDSVGTERASSAEMASMARFVRADQSRLVRLLAIDGDFPFYGTVGTQPADRWKDLKVKGAALVDESLAIQYGLVPGDSIRLGNSTFRLSATVTKFPGGSGILQTFTPSVYIPRQDLDSTGLVQFGSRVNYRKFIRTADREQAAILGKQLEPALKKAGHTLDTVETRKEGLGRAFGSVYRFFSLLAFIALVLGCIGVASSVSIYAREKRSEVAVLRCMGASGWQAFGIYFIQIMVTGAIASLIGAALGAAIQLVIPSVFRDFIPSDFTIGLSMKAMVEGFLTGVLVSVLFASLPLLAMRFVPPLTVLRAETLSVRRFSRARILVLALMVLFPATVAGVQTGSIRIGLGFTAGLLVALGLLLLTAELLLWMVRRYFPASASFRFRHALSGLYRPGNQTRLLMVTIGLGTFILSILNIVQGSLLGQVEFTGNANRSNAIMFDIQPPQRDGVTALLTGRGLPVNQLVPIVTCRLKEIKGVSVDRLREDSTSGVSGWALSREYRVTYRDTLTAAEELLSGKVQRLERGKRDSVFVTISEDFEDNIKAGVGDSLLFDVQGVPLKVIIGGIRKVDWPKDPPNFIFVFPAGVLDQAPQTWVAATRLPDDRAAADFQGELVRQFPNVSMIDLRLVLGTITAIFDKVGLVVRFLALFSIITGLIVLAGSVVNSRYARMKENILLRTIGARSEQITAITLIEYTWLGTFAALTGVLLSVAGGYLVCRFFFEVRFGMNVTETLLLTLAVTVLTVFIGWWNSRPVLDLPPLQILRREG